MLSLTWLSESCQHVELPSLELLESQSNNAKKEKSARNPPPKSDPDQSARTQAYIFISLITQAYIHN